MVSFLTKKKRGRSIFLNVYLNVSRGIIFTWNNKRKEKIEIETKRGGIEKL